MYGISLKVERHPGGPRQLTIHEGLFAEGNPLLTINTTTGRARVPKFILRASVRAVLPDFSPLSKGMPAYSPDAEIEFFDRHYKTPWPVVNYVAPHMPVNEAQLAYFRKVARPGTLRVAEYEPERSSLCDLVDKLHAEAARIDPFSVPVAMVPESLAYRVEDTGLYDDRILLQVFAITGMKKLMRGAIARPDDVEFMNMPRIRLPKTPESAARQLSTHLMRYWQVHNR